jgi:predicted dehydrogenase
MLLTDAELQEFWQAAASTIPIVIVGGGRWGRTWSIAAMRARGSGTGITIAARTDAAATRDWAQGNDGILGLMVAGSLAEAIDRAGPPVLAIIASRPRDHVRDGIEAIGHGLDVLVEKPISDLAQRGAELIALAREQKRQLAVCTEFALLPSFHDCAREFTGHDTNSQRIRLYWSDPPQDVRHGGVKRQHEETGVLIDLLPHAHSIFRIFSGSATLRLEALYEDVSQRGWLHLRDERGGSYELHYDKRAGSRRRMLEIETPTRTASVDFATESPDVLIDGVARTNPDTLHMRSTLRLALGAFLVQRLSPNRATPISADLDQLIRLQLEVEGQLDPSGRR